MKYQVKFTQRFKSDYLQARKNHQDIARLLSVIAMLANGTTLPKEYQDNLLVGNFHGCRECQILPNWQLIYKLSDDILMLECTRNGSHADLFR